MSLNIFNANLKFYIAGRVAGVGGSFDRNLIRIIFNGTPSDNRIKDLILEEKNLRVRASLGSSSLYLIRSGPFLEEMQTLLGAESKRKLKTIPPPTLEEPAFLYGYLNSFLKLEDLNNSTLSIKSSVISQLVLNSLRSEVRWAEYTTDGNKITLENQRRVLLELDPFSETN